MFSTLHSDTTPMSINRETFDLHHCFNSLSSSQNTSCVKLLLQKYLHTSECLITWVLIFHQYWKSFNQGEVCFSPVAGKNLSRQDPMIWRPLKKSYSSGRMCLWLVQWQIGEKWVTREEVRGKRQQKMQDYNWTTSLQIRKIFCKH